jgi:hypothetical protein
MPEPLEVFIVETSFRVPGLGVMALPTVPAPGWLADYALHTALAITVHTSSQLSQAITGTIEELVHDKELPRRGLLLDFNPTEQLRSGSYLIASNELAQLS